MQRDFQIAESHVLMKNDKIMKLIIKLYNMKIKRREMPIVLIIFVTNESSKPWMN